MGGSGSGKWYRLNKKAIADECHAIDINEINKASKLQPGYVGIITWTDFLNRQRGRVRIKIVPIGIELDYEDSRNEIIKYTVPLTFTPCNYGGQRPWFTCPKCGKRSGKLYLHGKYFLCRYCHNLAYASQGEDVQFRLMRKAKKIREKLDSPRDLSKPILFKPKGMHQRTFDKLWFDAMFIQHWLNRVANAEYQSTQHKNPYFQSSKPR